MVGAAKADTKKDLVAYSLPNYGMSFVRIAIALCSSLEIPTNPLWELTVKVSCFVNPFLMRGLTTYLTASPSFVCRGPDQIHGQKEPKPVLWALWHKSGGR
jgi:hypothetical protein